MKVLERKIYREILGWKNTLVDKYALLLEGARRVGKFNRHLGAKYVVCEGRYERDGGIVYLPSYMVHLI